MDVETPGDLVDREGGPSVGEDLEDPDATAQRLRSGPGRIRVKIQGYAPTSRSTPDSPLACDICVRIYMFNVRTRCSNIDISRLNATPRCATVLARPPPTGGVSVANRPPHPKAPFRDHPQESEPSRSPHDDRVRYPNGSGITEMTPSPRSRPNDWMSGTLRRMHRCGTGQAQRVYTRRRAIGQA